MSISPTQFTWSTTTTGITAGTWVGGGMIPTVGPATFYGPSGYYPNVPPTTQISYPIDLSGGSADVLNLLSNPEEIKKDTLFVIHPSVISTYRDIVYNKLSTNYFTLVENDLDNKQNEVTLKNFKDDGRSIGVVAYDLLNNRLEIASVYFTDNSISNIDMLLDERLQVKKDKHAYFSSLRSRFLPVVNFIFLEAAQDTLRFTRDIKAGLLPVIHVSNFIYNPMFFEGLAKKQKASTILESLNMEALLVNKSGLPDYQKNFTPEYGYLSLQGKQVIQQGLSKFDKSKQGLIDLLTTITYTNTDVIPFIECLLGHCALDQSILNIEEYAYLKIRHLIEINNC